MIYGADLAKPALSHPVEDTHPSASINTELENFLVTTTSVENAVRASSTGDPRREAAQLLLHLPVASRASDQLLRERHLRQELPGDEIQAQIRSLISVLVKVSAVDVEGTPEPPEPDVWRLVRGALMGQQSHFRSEEQLRHTINLSNRIHLRVLNGATFLKAPELNLASSLNEHIRRIGNQGFYGRTDRPYFESDLLIPPHLYDPARLAPFTSPEHQGTDLAISQVTKEDIRNTPKYQGWLARNNLAATQAIQPAP